MGKTPIKRPAELEYTPANCHARDVLARVGDKWSVYVIHVLGDAGTLRFNEVRGRVDGISQRMLTVTLRGMERDGLVARTVYPEVEGRPSQRVLEAVALRLEVEAVEESGLGEASPSPLPPSSVGGGHHPPATARTSSSRSPSDSRTSSYRARSNGWPFHSTTTKRGSRSRSLTNESIVASAVTS